MSKEFLIETDGRHMYNNVRKPTKDFGLCFITLKPFSTVFEFTEQKDFEKFLKMCNKNKIIN